MKDDSLDIGPAVLELKGKTILSEASIPLYHITGSVTTAQKDSTIRFQRIEDGPEPKTHDLFYMVHPVDARYRTDLPAQYYMTCVTPDNGMMGNIRLETTKIRLQKIEHRELLSPGTSARDQPLFNDGADQQLLFTARPGRKGYRWVDATGRHVASEDEYTLAVLIPLRRKLADALVALWILRMRFDTAESSQAKRECKYLLAQV